MIELTAVQHDLIPELAERLSTADQVELQRSGWDNPADAINDSVDTSAEVFMASWDGKVQAVFGVSEYHGPKPEGVPRVGIPWLLGVAPPPHVTREFMRISRSVVSRWRRQFPVLFNSVDADHLRAQRWLISLGLEPITVHSRSGFPFIEFGVKLCAP